MLEYINDRYYMQTKSNRTDCEYINVSIYHTTMYVIEFFVFCVQNQLEHANYFKKAHKNIKNNLKYVF